MPNVLLRRSGGPGFQKSPYRRNFRGATSHFADPDSDCEPVQIYEPGESDPVAPPDDVPPTVEPQHFSVEVGGPVVA